MKLEVKNINGQFPTVDSINGQPPAVVSINGSLQDVLRFMSKNRPFLDHPYIWRVLINDRFSVVGVDRDTGHRLTAQNVLLFDEDTKSGPLTLAQTVLSTVPQPDKGTQSLMDTLAGVEREFVAIDEDCHRIISGFALSPEAMALSIPALTKLQRNILQLKILQMRLARDVSAETNNNSVLNMAAELDGHIGRGLFSYSMALADLTKAFDSIISQFAGKTPPTALEFDHDDCDDEDDDDDDNDACDGDCYSCTRNS